MKLLLDTHIWIWSYLDPNRVARSVAEALEDTRSELWLSPLSVWEVLLLVERKRLVLEPNVESWLALAMTTQPLREAPLTHEVALETRQVLLSHRDPVDRLLIATARVYELTLVTADERLIGVKGLPVLPNR